MWKALAWTVAGIALLALFFTCCALLAHGMQPWPLLATGALALLLGSGCSFGLAALAIEDSQ